METISKIIDLDSELFGKSEYEAFVKFMNWKLTYEEAKEKIRTIEMDITIYEKGGK